MPRYAVGLLLERHTANVIAHSHTLHVHDAATPEEAIGLAVKFAMKHKPDFGIVGTLIMDAVTGEKVE